MTWRFFSSFGLRLPAAGLLPEPDQQPDFGVDLAIEPLKLSQPFLPRFPRRLKAGPVRIIRLFDLPLLLAGKERLFFFCRRALLGICALAVRARAQGQYAFPLLNFSATQVMTTPGGKAMSMKVYRLGDKMSSDMPGGKMHTLEIGEVASRLRIAARCPV